MWPIPLSAPSPSLRLPIFLHTRPSSGRSVGKCFVALPGATQSSKRHIRVFSGPGRARVPGTLVRQCPLLQLLPLGSSPTCSPKCSQLPSLEASVAILLSTVLRRGERREEWRGSFSRDREARNEKSPHPCHRPPNSQVCRLDRKRQGPEPCCPMPQGGLAVCRWQPRDWPPSLSKAHVEREQEKCSKC